MHPSIAGQYPLQKFQSRIANAGSNDGRNPLCQPAEQCMKPFDNDFTNREPCESSLFRMVEQIFLNRGILYRDKVSRLHKELREYLDVENRRKKSAIDNLRHEAQVIIAKWKDEYHAADKARSVVQKAHEGLQKSFAEVSAENENLRSNGPVCLEVNLGMEAAEDSGIQGERGLHITVQQVTASEIVAKILSLTLELQKRCHECQKTQMGCQTIKFLKRRSLAV